MTIYVPRFIHLLARVISNKNGEALASFIKRIIIVGVEEAASASFKASNALGNAIKSDQVSPEIKGEVLEFMQSYQELGSMDDEDEDEDEVG